MSTPSRTAHIGLWIAQVLLAVAFLGAGATKLTQPIDQLATQMHWVTTVPPWLVPLIGTAETLGALGLILPSALRIQPQLTPIAAGGLVTVMTLAAIHHVRIGDPMMFPLVNATLGGIALFIAWGRWKLAPIAPR